MAPHLSNSAMAGRTAPGDALPCVGSSTALKWGEDGELSDLDRQRILRRLMAADPVAQQLHQA